MNFEEIVTAVYNARKLLPDFKVKCYSNLQTRAQLVAEAQKTVSEGIISSLEKIEPGVSIVYGDEVEKSSGKRFILDPINGDVNMARGYNMSCMSVAYAEDDEVLFGIVYNPYSEEMFIALKGLGSHSYNTKFGLTALLKRGVDAYRDNELRVTEVDHKDAIIEFGTDFIERGNSDKSFALIKEIFDECQDIRRISAPALTLCNIAAGRIDGYFQHDLPPYAYAAASLILTEAGGRISKWDAKKITLKQSCNLVAGNPKVYKYLKNKLN